MGLTRRTRRLYGLESEELGFSRNGYRSVTKFGYHTFKSAAHIGERNPTWKLVH